MAEPVIVALEGHPTTQTWCAGGLLKVAFVYDSDVICHDVSYLPRLSEIPVSSFATHLPRRTAPVHAVELSFVGRSLGPRCRLLVYNS